MCTSIRAIIRSLMKRYPKYSSSTSLGISDALALRWAPDHRAHAAIPKPNWLQPYNSISSATYIIVNTLAFSPTVFPPKTHHLDHARRSRRRQARESRILPSAAIQPRIKACSLPLTILSPLTAVLVPVRSCRPSHRQPNSHPAEVQRALPVQGLLHSRNRHRASQPR